MAEREKLSLFLTLDFFGIVIPPCVRCSAYAYWADGKVYIGTDDGKIVIFGRGKDPKRKWTD